MEVIKRMIHESVELRVAVVDWPPGYENQAHTHEAIEAVTVQAGSCTLKEHAADGLREHALEPGDTFVIPRGILHQVVAGPDGLKLFAAVAPNDKWNGT